MKVKIAFNEDDTRKYTWQGEFPKTTKCLRCGGDCRLGFVAHEAIEEKHTKKSKYVYHLYDNDPDGEGFWLHDAVTVAVYFCKKCLQPTALYNQA